MVAVWLQEALDLRRAVDVLVQQFAAPETRLAYVGHSYGATLGGLIAVAERRFRALVLMGGYPSLSDSLLHPRNGQPVDPAVAAAFGAIDAERYIGQAAPATLFLQFARYDRYITDEQANRYAAAASNPKLVRWYDCGVVEFVPQNPQGIGRVGWLSNSRFENDKRAPILVVVFVIR